MQKLAKNEEKWHTLLCMSIFFCIFAADLCARAQKRIMHTYNIGIKLTIQINGRTRKV